MLTFEWLTGTSIISTDAPTSPECNPGTHGATGKLHGLLIEHFIGIFALPLRNIAYAAVIGEVNQGGVRQMDESIRGKRWLPSPPPRVIVCKKVCKDVCKGAVLSAVEADTLTYRILDGNHRLNVHREVYGLDGNLKCDVYRSFPSPGMSRAMSDCE